jgi:hypothetical protein
MSPDANAPRQRGAGWRGDADNVYRQHSRNGVPGSTDNGASALRLALLAGGGSLKDTTVLAVQNDPFRRDTPAGHRDGAWLAKDIRELGLDRRAIHLRGLHYALIGREKPNGKLYTNTDADWTWLCATAAKAARWLGYVAFDQVVDQRNSPPVVRDIRRPQPWPYIATGVHVSIPSADDLTPLAGVADFVGMQPYHLVVFGEKSSLEDILGRAAAEFAADLYLPSGEISDTLLYQMAKSGAADGRSMVVFCFSDCDPAGWQMPISIGRKLQAFKVALFAELEFQVRRVGLLPEHVRAYGLPSTPLKASEKRAGRWVDAMGVEQTEIDALASLQPELLDRIAREAMGAFFDFTLEDRVAAAEHDWMEEAQAVIDAAIDPMRLEQIKRAAEAKLDELREEFAAINDALRLDVRDFNLPDIEIPEADVAEPDDEPLVNSAWTFAAQTAALIDSRSYRGTS